MYVDNSNLKQICIAFYAYSEDHNGVFPVHPKEALRYIHDPSGTVFFSPFQENRGKLNLGRVDGPMLRYGSYVFVNLGFSLSEVEKPGARIIAYTAKISSDQTRRSVLFADGHAEIWDEDKLRAALPEGVDVDALDGP